MNERKKTKRDVMQKIKRNGLLYKSKVEYADFFAVTFKRPSTPQITPQVELTELENKIVSEIRTSPKITRNELAKKLGIGPETVKEYLDKLKAKGALRRVGKTRAGYWEILN